MKVNPGAGKIPAAAVDPTLPAAQKPPAQTTPKKPENVFTKGPEAVEGTAAPKSTEQLRLAVSGAVNRINLALLAGMGAGNPNPVIAGVLTATQFSQVMPALTPDQQKTMLTKLGLSDLTPQEFITGARAYSARFSEGLGAETKLNQASFSYVQQGKELNPAIQGGPIRTIDFATEGAAKINGDISDATNKMIPTLVEQSDVADLQVFLAAAAYIESPWGGGISFDAEDTQQGQFTADGSAEPTYVDLMTSAVTAQRLTKGPGFEAVYLPNGTSGNLGTIYIKPTSGSVADLIAAQGEKGLQNIIGDLTNPVGASTTQGAVRIPKTIIDFKPEGDAFLQTLQSLGLPSSANLLAGGAVDITKAAYVGKAETTEEGIKMAAAQGFGGLESMHYPPEPIVFDGNRSMLQLVVKDGQVLFFNPIVNPNAGGEAAGGGGGAVLE